MRITRAEARRIGALVLRPLRTIPPAPPRAAIVGLDKDTLQAWLPGVLRNHANGSHGHWTEVQGYRNRWRDKTVLVIRSMEQRLPWAAGVRKVVTFRGRSWNRMDDDGLAYALKGVRDGLIRAGVLDTDGPSGGHRFVYLSGIDRENPGVAIEVSARLLPARAEKEEGPTS